MCMVLLTHLPQKCKSVYLCRHEDFKDKVREIQKELAQKEMEAAQNFQTLLARVDSIRREHQLLAAHTEQLRQRKVSWNMNWNVTQFSMQCSIAIFSFIQIHLDYIFQSKALTNSNVGDSLVEHNLVPLKGLEIYITTQ